MRIRSSALSTQRTILVAILLVIVLVAMVIFDAAGLMRGSYNARYLAAATINVVPLAMLGLAQAFVIVSGRGGIALSVGSMVSLVGMIFGIAYGQWGVSLWLSVSCNSSRRSTWRHNGLAVHAGSRRYRDAREVHATLFRNQHGSKPSTRQRFGPIQDRSSVCSGAANRGRTYPRRPSFWSCSNSSSLDCSTGLPLAGSCTPSAKDVAGQWPDQCPVDEKARYLDSGHLGTSAVVRRPVKPPPARPGNSGNAWPCRRSQSPCWRRCPHWRDRPVSGMSAAFLVCG